jgi:hypothetical protein
MSHFADISTNHVSKRNAEKREETRERERETKYIDISTVLIYNLEKIVTFVVLLSCRLS